MNKIYKNLLIIFNDLYQAHEWIAKPNKAFNNKSALDLINKGEIKKVISYLEAVIANV